MNPAGCEIPLKLSCAYADVLVTSGQGTTLLDYAGGDASAVPPGFANVTLLAAHGFASIASFNSYVTNPAIAPSSYLNGPWTRRAARLASLCDVSPRLRWYLVHGRRLRVRVAAPRACETPCAPRQSLDPVPSLTLPRAFCPPPDNADYYGCSIDGARIIIAIFAIMMMGEGFSMAGAPAQHVALGKQAAAKVGALAGQPLSERGAPRAARRWRLQLGGLGLAGGGVGRECLV